MHQEPSPHAFRKHTWCLCTGGGGEYELSDEERAELDLAAQELAAAEAERLGWDLGGGEGLFDAEAVLAAADAAESGAGSAPGDAKAAKAARSGGRRMRAAGGAPEPREKEIPLALLPKAC